MHHDGITIKALQFWNFVSSDAKARILKDVFCTHCKTNVEILDYKVTESERGIDLIGRCKSCGHMVMRHVEGTDPLL